MINQDSLTRSHMTRTEYDPDYITISEVAKQLGCHKVTVWRNVGPEGHWPLFETHRLPSGQYRFPVDYAQKLKKWQESKQGARK